MELTDRERRILEGLERQLAGEQSAAASRAVPRRRASAPMTTLGLLLIAAGILLGVTSGVLLGLLFVGWFLPLRLRRSLRRAGRFLLNATANAVRQAPPGGYFP